MCWLFCLTVISEMQMTTMAYGRRPYGVGMLVAGYDVRREGGRGNVVRYFAYCGWITSQSQGPHLYQTCPSSNFYDCKAMCIGARSQVRAALGSLPPLLTYLSSPPTVCQNVPWETPWSVPRLWVIVHCPIEEIAVPLTFDLVCFWQIGTVDELVCHALQALRECLPSDAELTAKVLHFSRST